MTMALKLPNLTDPEIAQALNVGFFHPPASDSRININLMPSFFELTVLEKAHAAFETPRFNEKQLGRQVTRGQDAPVIFSLGGKPFMRKMNWGFVPYWLPETEKPHPQVMASVHEAHLHVPFRESFHRRRALVPARFFADIKKSTLNSADNLELFDTRSANVPPVADSCIQLLAGIWDTFKGADGKPHFGFALLGHKNTGEAWQALEVPVSEVSNWLGHRLDGLSMQQKLLGWNKIAIAQPRVFAQESQQSAQKLASPNTRVFAAHDLRRAS